MNEQAMRELLVSGIVARFEQRVKEFLEYTQQHQQASLSELEAEARRLSRDCFAPVLEAAIRCERIQRHPQTKEEPPRCCGCAGEWRYKGEQRRHQETYVGRISWERSYYYCGECGRGCYPLDEALGIGPGQFSAGIQEGVARLAATLPFALAAESFTALTGVSISGREVERLSEWRGSLLEEQEGLRREALLSGEETVPVQGQKEKPGQWVVALDAAKVRFEDGWHEAKAGVVCWVQPEGEEEKVKAVEQSYVVQVGTMEEAGERLYAEVIGRGIDVEKELLVCLADGAAGNWNQFALHFPRRAEVLDWYHAVEHLWAAGKGLYGEGSEGAKQWVEAEKEKLWQGQVEAVIATLHKEGESGKGQAATEEVAYFETNRERMRYPQFRAKGYPIGSGTVESACKRVIGARAKQAGMCWTKQGAQAILSLRAALLSNRWDEAWRSTQALALAA